MATTKKPVTEKTKKDKMLKMGKSYASVSEMIRDVADAETADDFDKYVADRRLVNCLTVLRCAKEVNQAELASRMGCGQSKVSKMESSADAELNFGDIVDYATSLGLSLNILFSPRRAKGADHIRFHLACIKRELDQLVKLAGDDRTIGEGIETYAIETMQKMVSVIEESIDKLPHRSRATGSISVEAEGEHGQPIPLDTPKRVRRSKGTPVGTR